MRKEIFKEFDGYDEILEEREVVRKYGLDYSPDKDAPEPYIRRLHPQRLALRVADIITETPSTKTFRLVSPERPSSAFSGRSVYRLVSGDRWSPDRPSVQYFLRPQSDRVL